MRISLLNLLVIFAYVPGIYLNRIRINKLSRVKKYVHVNESWFIGDKLSQGSIQNVLSVQRKPLQYCYARSLLICRNVSEPGRYRPGSGILQHVGKAVAYAPLSHCLS